MYFFRCHSAEIVLSGRFRKRCFGLAEVLRGINSLLHSTRVVNEGYNVAKAVNFVNKSWTKHIPTGAQCTCPEQIELRKIAALFHCLEKKKTDWIYCCAREFPDWELAFFPVSSPSCQCLKSEDSAWRFFWRCATRQCVPLENSAYFFTEKLNGTARFKSGDLGVEKHAITSRECEMEGFKVT